MLIDSKTQIKDACAGVIVTSSSYAIIEGCTITDAARIGKDGKHIFECKNILFGFLKKVYSS
jgi:hypothetical protein